MKTLKAGVIGAGHIFWHSHQKSLAQIEGVEIAAVCDPSKEARRRCEKELSVLTFAELDTMISAVSDLDVLLSLSPPFARKQAIQAAIDLDVPIFIEKPAAASVAEAEEILGLLEKSPVPVSVGFMFRYMPAVDRMRELLAEQAIIHVNSAFFCPALTQWNLPTWFLKKQISGGPVLDQAIHLFDLIRYLAGEITSVASFGSNVLYPQSDECTIEDSSSTIMRFTNGATGAHLHSWVHDACGGHVTIRTEHDCVTIDMEGKLTGQAGGEAVSFVLPESEIGKSDHGREMEVFLHAIRTGDYSAVRSDFADAVRSLAVAEAVNTAMATGKPITIEETS